MNDPYGRDYSQFKHQWKFDLPWHMVNLKEWFYMVNVGDIFGEYYLHVRIFGIRSLWIFPKENRLSSRTPAAPDSAKAAVQAEFDELGRQLAANHAKLTR